MSLSWCFVPRMEARLHQTSLGLESHWRCGIALCLRGGGEAAPERRKPAGVGAKSRQPIGEGAALVRRP